MASKQYPDSIKRILNTVTKIPYGKVASYGQIADLAGMPGRARLVGKVLAGKHANALPWYRVIRSSGQIAFPAYSETASMQSERLESEGIAVVKNRVKMSDYQWQPNLPELLMQLEH